MGRLRRWPLWLAAALTALSTAAAAAEWPVRFADVVQVPGTDLAVFEGCPIERLALLACVQGACRPIPFQIDVRDAQGWRLDQGPGATPSAAPEVLTGEALLLFMASDAAEPAGPNDFPHAKTTAEVTVRDPLSGAARFAYLVAFPESAPRSPVSYVHYDPATDRVRGAHVSLGFNHGVPSYLSLAEPGADDGVSLLDRFKVRASATFLFGLIHLSRSEEDLSTEFVGWRQGPIRVIRRQRQWVRLGWGIHSPTFGSYTYFYRDFAELPVGLYLNFPPTYFFGNILVRAFLDFRDLTGWSVVTPGLAAPLAIGAGMTAQKNGINRLSDSWFALLGPQITLLQTLGVSPSLATVRRRLYFREDPRASDPPEDVAGEVPAIGYQLDQWERVGAGNHQLESISYALPAGLDPRQFMSARQAPLQVTVQSSATGGGR